MPQPASLPPCLGRCCRKGSPRACTAVVDHNVTPCRLATTFAQYWQLAAPRCVGRQLLSQSHHLSVERIPSSLAEETRATVAGTYFDLIRYVESKPLRARRVADLALERWSSYPVQGLGRADDLVPELPGWRALGPTEAARQACPSSRCTRR
jgi:hypothetical protein